MTKRTMTDADTDLLIERFREVFLDKHEFEEKVREIVKEEIKHLPSREEFLEETGKIYKKQSDLEDEKDVLSHRVSKHTDQISKIEKHLGFSALE